MNDIPFSNNQMCICKDLLLSQRLLTAEGDVDSCMERCKKFAYDVESPLTSENKDQNNAVSCIDEGKEYKVGAVWRKKCHDFSCNQGGKVTVKAVKCDGICVSKEDEKSKCCRVCVRKITCKSREITLEIPRPMLRDNDLRRLTLSDQNCKPVINETHVTFRTKPESCGTKLRKARRGIVYTNTVQKSYGFIARALFKFSCLFKVKYFNINSNLAAGFKVNKPQSFTFGMIYTDANGRPEKRYPTDKQVMEGKHVFVEIRVNEKLKSHQFLVVERCAIISLNRRKSLALLEYGCPLDSTMRILTKTPKMIWFSFQAKVFAKRGSLYSQWFKYKNKRFHPKDKEYVDLSCQAAVCSKKSAVSICNRKCRE